MRIRGSLVGITIGAVVLLGGLTVCPANAVENAPIAANVAGAVDPIFDEVFAGSDGLTYHVEFNRTTGEITVSDSAGKTRTTTVSELQAFQQRLISEGVITADGKPGPAALSRKPINGCMVATGVAGIAQSALWGGVVGGGPGIIVGAAVGAIWWAVGTQC